MPHPKGGYRLKDGTRVPGVTTIIGRFKDSGALLWWAFNQGKAAERGEIGSLYDKRDEAADAGTLAHLMVERHVNGEKPPALSDYPKDIVKQARQGFENYLNWAGNNRMVIVRQEMELVSEKHRFGGCPDGLAYDNQNRLVLIDWKTSAKGVYVDYLLQLAAYKVLWEETNPNQPITGGFHLCQFSRETADFHHHYWKELTEAWHQFLLFRQAYEIDKKLKQRV